jgi:hypothetical protein
MHKNFQPPGLNIAQVENYTMNNFCIQRHSLKEHFEFVKPQGLPGAMIAFFLLT